MRKGVGDVEFQPVRICLFERGEQSVIVRDPDRRPEDRIGTVPNVGNAQIGVAAGGSVIGLIWYWVAILAEHLIAIRVSLTVYRIRCGGDIGLVEGQRNGLMNAMIPCIAKRESYVLPRLPLHIQAPVLGVGRL